MHLELSLFQSTHPRGVRLSRVTIFLFEIGFNPRTREGCDKRESGVFILIHVSIHAPARGATSVAGEIIIVYMFQSTHPRGVRQTSVLPLIGFFQFQSTHPRGVRLMAVLILLRA